MAYRSGLPPYLQIAEVLRSRIQEVAWQGRRLPSEPALCAEFRVSRPTVRQALDLLVEEGLLSRHRGRGTFTSPMGSLPRKLRIASKAVAELLNVPPRTPLLHFRRTYFSDGGDPVEHALTYQVGQRYPYKVLLFRSDRKG